MKRTTWKPMLCGLLLAWGLAASDAMGQQIGVSFGYEHGLWLSREEGFDTTAIRRMSPMSSVAGAGSRDAAWLGVQYILPRVFGEHTGLELGASLGLAAGTYQETVNDVFVIVTSVYSGASKDDIITDHGDVRYDIEYNTASMRLHLLTRHTLFGSIGIEGGAWGEYRIGGSYSRSIYLVEPTYGVIENLEGYPAVKNGRGLVVIADTSFSSPPLSGGAMLGLSGDMRLGRNVSLHPALRLLGDFGRLADGISWRSLGLGASLGLRFDLSPPAEFSESPSFHETAPEQPPLRASIDLYSEGAGGEHLQSLPVRRQRVVTTQHLPFIPVVYYEEGSENLPERYMLLAPGHRNFTPDSFAGRDLRWLHYQGLNVLGLRLQQSPADTITLMGITAAGEAPGLGRRRAERVRRYLRDVWDVDERRASVGERRGEVPSVLVENASPAIAGTVASEWRATEMQSPQIGLRPAMDGGGGLERWEITLWLGGRRIAHHSSDDTGDGTMTDVGMVLKDLGGDADAARLTAELAVRDSAGAMAVSRDDLPVEFSTAAALRKRSIHLLPVPGVLSGVSAPSSLESIAREIRHGSRITVRYPAPATESRTAAADYAEHVASILSALLREDGIAAADPVVATAEPVQSHGWPEDHLLSSAVTVEVEWEE